MIIDSMKMGFFDCFGPLFKSQNVEVAKEALEMMNCLVGSGDYDLIWILIDGNYINNAL